MPAVQPFGVKNRQAIDNIRQKTPVPTEHWNDLPGPLHGKQFAIAGATDVDMLRDMHAAISDAIENGKTLSQFRKDFDKIVQQYGWSYNGSRGWRTQVIYGNNMRSAAMAGKWQRIVDNVDNQPYLRYVTAGDAQVRPEHAEWEGTILPVDDPFWKTHYPPNGWGCRCDVRPVSKDDLKGKGWEVSDSPDDVYENVTDEDGVIVDRVPIGIDPGWDHNVGEAWIEPELALGQKLSTLPTSLQAELIPKTINPAYQEVLQKSWEVWFDTIQATGQPRGVTKTIGYFDDKVFNAVMNKLPEESRLQSINVSVIDRKTDHLTGNHKPGKGWTDAQLKQLPVTLANYRAVLWDEENETLIVIANAVLNGRVSKVVVRPNQEYGNYPVNSIVSLGTDELVNLKKSKQYKLLVGNL